MGRLFAAALFGALFAGVLLVGAGGALAQDVYDGGALGLQGGIGRWQWRCRLLRCRLPRGRLLGRYRLVRPRLGGRRPAAAAEPFHRLGKSARLGDDGAASISRSSSCKASGGRLAASCSRASRAWCRAGSIYSAARPERRSKACWM